MFSLQYMLSKNAQSVPNAVIIWKVDAQGAKEYVIADRGDLEDWTSETGQIAFGTFSITRDFRRDRYLYTPDLFVLQGTIGMTPIYSSMPQHWVDDPVYLEISLVSPEAYDGKLLLSRSSKQLSNTVRIDLTP